MAPEASAVGFQSSLVLSKTAQTALLWLPWSPSLLLASPFLNPSPALGYLGLRCYDECVSC